MAEIVKITHVEDTISNIEASKRAGLIALVTDEGITGEVSFYDSSLNRHRLATMDVSGTVSQEIEAATINELQSDNIVVTETLITPKCTVENVTAAQQAITKTGETTILIESGSIPKITAYDYTAHAARKLYLQTDGEDLIVCSAGGIFYQGNPTTNGSARTRLDGAGNVYHEVRVSGSWVLA